MTKPKPRREVMKEIRKVFTEEELFLKKSEDFYGEVYSKGGMHSGGIWTSGETGVFQYWNHYTDPRMEKILDNCDWWAEWYDSGTVMLYPS